MAWTLVNHGMPPTGNPPQNVTYTDTGADLLLAGVSDFAGGATPQDSIGGNSNTWNTTISGSTTRQTPKIFHAHGSLHVGASHQFSSEGNAGYVGFASFSGSTTGATVVDQTGQAKSGALGATTVATPSITPSQNNSLIFVCFSFDDPSFSTSVTLNNGFTVLDQGNEVAGSAFGCVTGYLIQSTAAAISCTATRPNAGANSAGQDGALIASFIPAASSSPFVQYDWPLPRAPRQPAVGWTSSYNLNLIGQDKLPNRQSDWPLPGSPRPPDAYRSWEWQFRPLLIGQDSLPNRQLDWPLPRPVDPPEGRRSWTQSFNLSLIGKDALPVRQMDWPLPRAADPPGKTWTQAYNPNLVGQDALPVRQLDWPLPLRVPGYRSWELNLLQTTLAPILSQLPFNQYDWPLPRGADQPSRSFTGSYLLTLIGQDALPFRQLDWPVPPRPAWYREWAQNLLQTTLTPVFVQMPFNQYDWRLPVPASTWQAAPIPPNLVINLPPPPPGSAPNRIYVIW